METIRLLCLQVHQHVKGYFKASLNISVGFWCFLKLQYYDTASVCVSTGRGGNSAESCRRPGLCPSSPSGPAAQPFSFFWKAGRSVRKLHGGSTFVLLFFLNSSPFADCDLAVISQVAFRKFVQHQHRHKHSRVSGLQKSSECL